MSIRSAIQASVDAVQEEILRLAGSLNERERNTSGSPDQWEPRDMLVHLGQSKRFCAEDLAAARLGEAPTPEEEPGHSNQAVFEMYRSRPWEEIIDLVEQSHREFTEQLSTFSDEELNNPDQYAWLNGTPLWRRTAGLCVIHATVHLAQYYIARGDLESGRRMARLEKDLATGIDQSDNWLGMVHYNQGCYHALLGEKDLALQELERGFGFSPRFVEVSREDPDLASLHSDPDFQELQNRVKPKP